MIFFQKKQIYLIIKVIFHIILKMIIILLLMMDYLAFILKIMIPMQHIPRLMKRNFLSLTMKIKKAFHLMNGIKQN